MARSIYIASVEGHAGKSTIALGVLDALSRELERVGVFRPVARSSDERDYVLELLLAHDGVGLDYGDCVGVSYEQVHSDPEAALSEIVSRYKAVERQCGAVVILGSDYTDVGSPTELSFNARIAANLGAPVLLVLGGRQTDDRGSRSADDIRQVAELALVELEAAHASVLAIVANRVAPELLDPVVKQLSNLLGVYRSRAGTGAGESIPVWAIPEDQFLIAPSMASLMEATGGTLVKGDPELLSREALGVVVAAMSMENVLTRLTEGAVVVLAGDRSEVLLAL
ncbi:MAG: phosphotransacetylase family protein, partial [Lacisediminihabitans sp.]